MTTYFLAVVIAGFTYSAFAGVAKRILESSSWWKRQEDGLIVMGYVFWPAVIAAYILWFFLTPFVGIGRFAYSLTAASLYGEDKEDEKEFPPAQVFKERKNGHKKAVQDRHRGWES